MDAAPVVKQMAEDAKPKAEEAGKYAMDTLSKVIETAKPVVDDVIRGTLDFMKEVAEETKPVEKDAQEFEEESQAPDEA